MYDIIIFKILNIKNNISNSRGILMDIMTKENNSTKGYFTIPNILCYIRILLIPFFIYSYINAKKISDYYLVAGIVLLSGLTDFADGFIARKYNQVTEIGKFIDPVADKLTQATIVVSLMFKIKWMWLVVLLFIVKESFMAINSAFLFFKKGKKLDGAKWYGKVSTAVFYVVMFTLIIFPMMNIIWINTLLIITSAFLTLSFIMYIPEFIKLYKEK